MTGMMEAVRAMMMLLSDLIRRKSRAMRKARMERITTTGTWSGPRATRDKATTMKSNLPRRAGARVIAAKQTLSEYMGASKEIAGQ